MKFNLKKLNLTLVALSSLTACGGDPASSGESTQLADLKITSADLEEMTAKENRLAMSLAILPQNVSASGAGGYVKLELDTAIEGEIFFDEDIEAGTHAIEKTTEAGSATGTLIVSDTTSDRRNWKFDFTQNITAGRLSGQGVYAGSIHHTASFDLVKNVSQYSSPFTLKNYESRATGSLQSDQGESIQIDTTITRSDEESPSDELKSRLKSTFKSLSETYSDFNSAEARQALVEVINGEDCSEVLRKGKWGAGGYVSINGRKLDAAKAIKVYLILIGVALAGDPS